MNLKYTLSYKYLLIFHNKKYNNHAYLWQTDVKAFKKTHTVDDADLKKLIYRAGHRSLDSDYNKQYEIAIYVKNDIDETGTIHKEMSQIYAYLYQKYEKIQYWTYTNPLTNCGDVPQ